MLTDLHQQLLTHYALGELPPARLAEIEALLANDPEARAWIADVRRTTTRLSALLQQEGGATGGLDARRRAVVAATAARRPRPVLRWLPVAAALAAAIAVALLLDRPTERPASQPVGGTIMPHTGPAPVASPQQAAIILPPSPDADLDAPQMAIDAIASLDTAEEAAAESASKGREEAVASVAIGSSGTFVAVGCGGGASLGTSAAGRGRRGTAPAGGMHGGPAGALPQPRVQGGPVLDGETYAAISESGFADPRRAPLSTFGLDVDTAAYANVRRFIEQGRLPPRDAVRIEEMLNAFAYGDPPPAADAEQPFSVHAEVGACPWSPGHRLARIAVRARDVDGQRPPCNLVFLIDVSGSMDEPRRLGLVQRSLRMLTGQLRAEDRVAIVTYANSARLVLPSTPASEAPRILAAVDALRAGGSTNGAGGIQLAYATAQANAVAGVNRVVLCTDGDFNVGAGSPQELRNLIEEKRRSSVTLTVLGYGMGNLKDANLQMLAGKGDGTYAYIDSEAEARRALVQQLDRHLVMVAKDAKVQVEFNPERVAAWRLVGYEKRLLQARDFADDRVDSGDIGAGAHVTALYEIEPRTPASDSGLRYQSDGHGELLFVQLRWKRPDLERSELLRLPVVDRDAPGGTDLRFAAAIAAFGMTLRDSPARGSASLALARDLARGALGEDRDGSRAGFLRLAQQAMELAPER